MRKIIKLSAILAMILLMAVGLTGCILDDILPPLVSTCDHEWQDATCTEPYQCVLCGETEGAPLGHHWRKATCTSPEMCSRCGEKNGQPLDHDWSKPTCTEPATCHMCGITNGRPDGHKWSTPTCTEPAYCYHCGETDGESEGHNLVSATCITDGYCSTCGETLEPINENAHDMEGNKCTLCGESFYPTIYVSSETYSKSSGYDTVTIVVSIEENPGVTGIQLVFDYNSDVMILDSFECSNALSSSWWFNYSVEKNVVILDKKDLSEPELEDVEIVILTFRIDSNAVSGDYRILVDEMCITDCIGTKITSQFNIINGTITVTD